MGLGAIGNEESVGVTFTSAAEEKQGSESLLCQY